MCSPCILDLAHLVLTQEHSTVFNMKWWTNPRNQVTLHDITHVPVVRMIMQWMTAMWNRVMQNFIHSTFYTRHSLQTTWPYCKTCKTILISTEIRQATYCVLCGVQFTFKSKLYLTYWRMYAVREVPSDSFHSPDKLHGRTTAKCNIRPTGENASGFNFDAACRNCANT